MSFLREGEGEKKDKREKKTRLMGRFEVHGMDGMDYFNSLTRFIKHSSQILVWSK